MCPQVCIVFNILINDDWFGRFLIVTSMLMEATGNKFLKFWTWNLLLFWCLRHTKEIMKINQLTTIFLLIIHNAMSTYPSKTQLWVIHYLPGCIHEATELANRSRCGRTDHNVCTMYSHHSFAMGLQSPQQHACKTITIQWPFQEVVQ